jgi:predicted amidohydrolase
VWSRNNQDYDLAIYVASWPAKRQLAWDTLLRARAIENQCYLVGVNRVGDDPALHYSGGSVILDPNGEILAACESEKEQVAVAEIDIKNLEEFRKKFPVLDDIDNFILK